MKEIPLRGASAKGRVALVDDGDFDRLSISKWHADSWGYAFRYDGYKEGRKQNKKVYMHREILGAIPDGMVTDHINRDKLDNQRNNLRVVTQLVNAQNKGASGVTGVRGVSLNHGRYRARIFPNGQRIYVGNFATLEEAAVAVERARVAAGDAAPR